MSLLLWLPLTVIVFIYTCSWPNVPRMRTYLAFDGMAICFSVLTPLVWLLYRAQVPPVTSADYEEQHWMPLLLPFWTTLFGSVSLTLISIFRFFIFRDRKGVLIAVSQ
jgi:hypothetical protein